MPKIIFDSGPETIRNIYIRRCARNATLKNYNHFKEKSIFIKMTTVGDFILTNIWAPSNQYKQNVEIL